MKIGVSKRIASYLLDIMPIITLFYALHTLFIGTVLQNAVDPNYSVIESEYFELIEERNTAIDAFRTQFNNEEITEDEYFELSADLQDEFFEENKEVITTITQYWLFSFLYFAVLINITYFAYMLGFKGQSLGRKIMKIELMGNIKWHTILLREVMWKNLLYTFAIIVGLALNPILGIFSFVFFVGLDIGLITFTKKKKTLRDMFSQTYLGYEGVDYPF
jgi:hypothetical protein